MPHERRLAAYAAIGLFLTMFLPWYQRQFFTVVGGRLTPGSDSQTAWAQFSFVEAAVLLVAVAVLTLLFQRAEGKAFHLPGGDGWVITAAGLWTCVLIIWRIFDKQGGSTHGQDATTYGIEWGIFVALAIAASLAYAGSRIRASHRPEPPLPGEPDDRDRNPAGAGGDPADSPQLVIRRAKPGEAAGAQSVPRREQGWLTARPDDRDPDQRRATTSRPADERRPDRRPERRPEEPSEGRSDDGQPEARARRRAPAPRWAGESPPDWYGNSPPEWPARRRRARLPADEPPPRTPPGEDPTVPAPRAGESPPAAPSDESATVPIAPRRRGSDDSSRPAG